MNVTTPGNCRIRSTRSGFVSDDERIPEIIRRQPGKAIEEGVLFELAGPREWLFFDPKLSRAGIVTCGGLCPGLNNVVRSLFRELHDGRAGRHKDRIVALYARALSVDQNLPTSLLDHPAPASAGGAHFYFGDETSAPAYRSRPGTEHHPNASS